MGCLERAGFAAGSVCGSSSGICSDGTSKSATVSYCRNICCIAHCISPASISSRCGAPGVAASAKLNFRPSLAAKHVPVDKPVLQKWLKAGYVENRSLFPTTAGTPQGGIISPTLANMTLDGLEKLLLKHFPREKWKDGKIWRPKVNLVRYADDFIITGDSKELLENEVRPLVERFLKERGLGAGVGEGRDVFTTGAVPDIEAGTLDVPLSRTPTHSRIRNNAELLTTKKAISYIFRKSPFFLFFNSVLSENRFLLDSR
jgi:hypothetical protein